MTPRPQRFVVLCPHFAPDIAPTGKVMTQLVAEWASLGHEVHVVTSLPWYRNHQVEPSWRGRLVRREVTQWGSITRVHPFPAKSKSNLFARAAAFVAFSVIAGLCAMFAGGKGRRFSRVDAVIAMFRHSRWVSSVGLPPSFAEPGSSSTCRTCSLMRS
jgi:colanic acid biosynthesis glycosyl transferase WcaI